MSGDNLTVALFLLSTGLTVVLALVGIHQWRHKALLSALWLLAICLLLLGVVWPWAKEIPPQRLVVAMQLVAAHPMSYVVLALSLAVVLAIRERRKDSRRSSRRASFLEMGAVHATPSIGDPITLTPADVGLQTPSPSGASIGNQATTHQTPEGRPRQTFVTLNEPTKTAGAPLIDSMTNRECVACRYADFGLFGFSTNPVCLRSRNEILGTWNTCTDTRANIAFCNHGTWFEPRTDYKP